jgi:threonine dehydrogenase-like Zn-dependent dehydrogenase
MPADPGTMRAAVVRGRGEIAVEERPRPQLDDRDVLVEVSFCGVCGSDIHMALDGWGRPGSILGHEWSGVVAEVGPSVRRWSQGDPVVGGPTRRCGVCRPCRAGRPALCDKRSTPGTTEWQGAFATYIRAHEDELLALPTGVDLRSAALAEPLAVALHGLTQARVENDDRALVVGVGPIGQLTLAALRARGVHDVGAVEPAPSRARLARALGAASVRAPDELEVPSIAEPDRIVADAVDVVFECSGKRSAMEAGLAQLRRGGRLVLVGAGIEAPRFDPNRILLNELVVTGSFTYDATGFDDALELISSGRIPVDLLLEPDEVPLSGVRSTMEQLARGELAAKVLVVPGSEEAR